MSSTTSNNPICGATINDSPQNQIYCCNGLLLDIAQGILGTAVNQNPFYFKDLRCCSGDSNVALASVTFCTAGMQGELVTSMENGGSSTSQSLMTMTSGSAEGTWMTTGKTGMTTAEGTSMAASATGTAKSEGSKGMTPSVMGYVCLAFGILGVLGGY